MNDTKRLTTGLSGLNLELSDKQRDKLLAYKDLLLHWNLTYNLISRNDSHRIIERHILDSLSVLRYMKGKRVADIGCGAGLPGIPLSIALEEIKFTLVDRSLRKVRFLRHAVLDLKLENVEVESWNLDGSPVFTKAGSAVGSAQPDVVEFDTIVARAMSQPQKVWVMARPLVRLGGQLVIQCGLNTELPEAFPGAKLVQDTTLTISDSEAQHRALVLQKHEG